MLFQPSKILSFLLLIVAFAAFVLFPSNSYAAISLVQKAKNTSSTSPLSVTWGSATTAGNFLVAVVMAQKTTSPEPTLGAPSGWTEATSINFASTAKVAIFYKENAASETSTGNFTASGSLSDFQIIVAEYSGVATSSSLDKTATNSGSDTSPSTGTTATTAQASELLVGGLAASISVTYSSPTNGFTIQDTNFKEAFLDRIVSATGTYSTGATQSSSGSWAGVIATFKDATVTASVSGTAYTDEGTTAMGSGRTVSVSINGAAAAGSATTNASGAYTISNLTISAGDVLTLYLDGNTEKGVTVTRGTGANMTGIDIYQNDLISRCDNASCSLTNSNLDTADNNADSDISDIYSVSGGSLTVASGKSIFIPASHTFAPGGNVSVGGNFTNNGTYTKGTETLTLTGTSSQNLKTSGSSLYNLTINGSGGTYTLQDALTASNNLTITAGTLDVSGSNYGLTVGNNWSNSGTFTARSGTLTFNATATGKTITAGGSSFYNLTFNGSGGGWTLQDAVTVAGALTITAGNLDAGSQTITLSGTGTILSNSGTFTASTSTILITDTSSNNKTFAGGGKTYNNLAITGGGSGIITFSGSNTFNDFTINYPKTVTFTSSTTQTINGTFSCTAAALSIIEINASAVGTAATLSKSSGTVSCDYVSLKDSAATGGATWNAGCNSTNVSGNSGWTFGGSSCSGGGSGGSNGTVVVNKTAIGGDGTFNFTTTGSGYLNFSITTINGSGSYSQSLYPGTYSAVETVPSGWTKTEDTCGAIEVAPGRTTTCSITNTINSLLSPPPSPPPPPPPPPSPQPSPPPLPPPPPPPPKPIPPPPPPLSPRPTPPPPPPALPPPPQPLPPPIELLPPLPPDITQTPDSRLGIIADFRKKAREIAETPVISFAAKTVSTIGAATAVVLTATQVVSSASSVSNIYLNLIRLAGSLLTAFGLKKRFVPWGVAYDSVTKQPLDPAYVTLRDNKGNVSSMITDVDGRYGFLVNPGAYEIEVQKTNYSFPSDKARGKTSDEIYDNLYFGGPITIKKAGDAIFKNIPLDPIKFDWNEFAKKNKTFMKFYSRWDLFLRKVYDVSFVAGFIVSAAAFFLAPYPFNTIILEIYLVLLLLKVLGLKPKSLGYVTEKSTGVPLSFALIRIVASYSNSEISQKVADKYGRYYCLVPKGQYYVKIDKKNADGSYSHVYTSEIIDARKSGIIKNRFKV